MKIRFKMLILLLIVSISPLILVQIWNLESLRSLSNEISSEVRNELILKSSIELKRIVEDHARVVTKQRKIVGLNLQQISSEISSWVKEGNGFILPDVFNGELSNEEVLRLNKKYERNNRGMMCEPYISNFNALKYRERDNSSILPLDTSEKLLPLFKSIEARNPNLVLWIKAKFISGEVLSYPSIVDMLGMTQDNLKLNLTPQVDWSAPKVDGLTGRTVVTASVGIFSNKKAIGSVFIDVPLDVLFQGYNHLKKYSKNIDSMLVKPITNAQNSDIQIVAKEVEDSKISMMGIWENPTKRMILNSESSDKFTQFQSDLQNNKSGYISMPYKGRDSLWAYSSADKHGLSLVLILPYDDIVAPAERAKFFIKTVIKDQSFRNVGILFLVMLFSLVLAFMFSRKFTRNILVLASGVKKIASGDFSTRVKIDGNDEIGELASDFNVMVPTLKEHVQIKSALDVAMEVQANLLPQSTPIIEGYDIYGESRYCDELGGDYFDYIYTGKSVDDVLFAVGDVSGHGVSAAMLMGSARGYLRARSISGGSLGDIVTDVNSLVAKDTYKTGMFMTLLMVKLCIDKNELSWVRAGHDPVLLFDDANKDFVLLEGSGIALGLFDDANYFENYHKNLSAGQMLVLGTDGIWEASNDNGEFFGKKRLWDFLKKQQDNSAQSLVTELFSVVQDFVGKGKLDDDLTVMVIKKNK